MMTEEKFSKEREQVLRAARQGISSNIPLAGVQKILKKPVAFCTDECIGQ